MMVRSCVFCFFKQKTAYEMRISDWSSDVCSSDLAHASPRGPACSDSLIAAGVTRVVIAALDPDPRTDGQGIARLQAAGVEVVFNVLPAEARAAMAPCWVRQTEDRPFVTLKLATSLAGPLPIADGTTRRPTGARARSHAPPP